MKKKQVYAISAMMTLYVCSSRRGPSPRVVQSTAAAAETVLYEHALHHIISSRKPVKPSGPRILIIIICVYTALLQ